MGFFEHRYAKIVGDFSADVEERPALRVNTLKTSPAALLERLNKKGVRLEKVPWLAHGYWYEAPFSLGATPEYLLGLYYLQGAASQLVTEVLNPKPGEFVLDMAAAPGGKATHAAMLMGNAGTLVLLDTHAQRLEALRNNCERLGVKNCLLFRKDARYVADLGFAFDKVVLDAPCSGNFCGEPGWFAKRDLTGVQSNARVQKDLVLAAANVLKPGGTLVYSTCSLEPEEDECVVDWLLSQRDDVALEELDLAVGDPGVTSWDGKALSEELVKTKRFWPHRTGTEGFFVAKLKKGVPAGTPGLSS